MVAVVAPPLSCWQRCDVEARLPKGRATKRAWTKESLVDPSLFV